MMVHWQCPHCNTNFHSAWPRRDQKTVKCENLDCGADIPNPYYDPRGGISCPSCGSKNIHKQLDSDWEEDCYWYKCTCEDCKSYWETDCF